MDGTRLKAPTIRPFRLAIVLFVLLSVVTVGSRLGGSAQEGIATPGASPEASPGASPVASPVAGTAGDVGRITLRVLGCDVGTTAEAADPTVCGGFTGDLDIDIAGAGEPLTVAEALRLSAGVFRWPRVPYDTYTVTLAALPDGYTSLLATDDSTATPIAITDEGFDVTVDATEPSPTFTLYLIP